MNLFSLLDELRAIAQNGLHYSSGAYDRERYERLLDLVTRTYSEVLDFPNEAVRARCLSELGQITPKVGAGVALFNERGEILLMDRADGTGWCLPCGWVEPNERPIEAAIREAREETGLEITIKQLVGVFTRMPGPERGPHTVVAVIHLGEVVGGELQLSYEGLDLRYWPIDEVSNWYSTHEQYARASYAVWRSGELLPAVSN